MKHKVHKLNDDGKYVIDEEASKNFKPKNMLLINDKGEAVEPLNLGVTKIYLGITADELDFDYIEALLGMKRDQNSWKKGDSWRNTGRKRFFTRWNSEELKTKEIDLDDVILNYIKPLNGKHDELKKIINKFDASIVLQIVPYINPNGLKQILPSSLALMKELVQLDLYMDIDYYIE